MLSFSSLYSSDPFAAHSLVLIVRSMCGSGFFKNNVVLPDKHEQPSVSIENKETIKEPDKNPIQPTASTKEPKKEEKIPL